jgi:hypothetical protein
MKGRACLVALAVMLLVALSALGAHAWQSLIAALAQPMEALEGPPPVEREFLNTSMFAVDRANRPVTRAEDADESLRLYAVHVYRTGEKNWTGYGIHLGRGIVITAAHVAGLGFWRRPQVEIAGQKRSTNVVKDGHFHHVDLTVLSVDERQLPVSLRLRRLALCQNALWVGEEVIVATPEGVARSEVMSPYLLPLGAPVKSYAVIRYVEATGASGSGVFDANRRCLVGIISGEVVQMQVAQGDGHAARNHYSVAKYFVPASTIAKFMPQEAHF